MNTSNFIESIKKILKIPIDILVNLINSILLSCVYILGIGITAFFARITHKRFLSIEKDNNKKTYWKKIVEEKEDHLRTF